MSAGIAAFLSGLACAGAAGTVLVEAESFDNHGGWMLDTQFIEIMGSPYLLAHGLGKPVGDAETVVKFPASGKYRMWARTKDWVAPWDVPGSPGRFQLAVDGKPLTEYPARGTTYIEALHGREYTLRLTNLIGRRIAVALAVDGLNSIDAKTTPASEASKWVLGPYETITIESILGSTRDVRVIETTAFGSHATVVPEASGRAYFTGQNEFWFDPADSLKGGSIFR